ncbi:MAG TPA: hypothetical protein VMT15_18815 [Bryobacteraceae bacterium]|nr:hypothetical protein [Bryobacteraceae bacterium]
MRTFMISTVFCSAAFAQVGGPFLGYVPEGTGIRPMYGLPGAGAIGSTIDTGRSFARMSVSPRQNFAIAVAADTGGLLVVKPGVSIASVGGAEANPDILAISPEGSAAAAWFPLSNRLEIVSGLPDAPSIRIIDASFLNASPLAIAVSDDGQWSAGLWSAGVYAFGPDNAVIPLQTDQGVLAVAFFHNRHDLALAGANRATSITDLGGSLRTSVLYDYSAQGLTPRAVGLSFDNQIAVVADRAGALVAIPVSGAGASTYDCGCFPEGLYGLGGALFRLNGTGAGRERSRAELKLFDGATGRVLIVPPALSLAGGRP